MENESEGEGVILPEELEEDDGAPRTPPYGGSVPRPASYSSGGSMGSVGSVGSAGFKGRTDRLVGETLDGRFKILRLIARGGMGRIYEAEQIPLGRIVALKVMDLSYAEELDPDFQKRFFLEASTCARLTHPNTIRVFDYGNADDETFYIVMEFIPGRTLLKTINEDAPLPPLQVIHIASQICGSLAEAHGQGVIHRDLKPSNVLLTEHGETRDFVKVLDFGLVKLIREGESEITKSGLFLGSPNYMSPEQIRSNKVDQRSDIYSLGVLLFMCLTGRAPFKRDTSVKVLLAQLEDDPPDFSEFLAPQQVPDSLEWVVRTCLAKKRRQRFASVDELNRALRAVEAELLGHTEGPLGLTLDEEGRVQVPDGLEIGTSSIRWTGSHPRAGASIPPVSSAGSLISDRVREDEATPPPKAAPPPRDPSRPRRTRSRAQKRPPPGRVELMMQSPWFAASLGAAALALLTLLVLLLRGVLVPAEPVPPPAAPGEDVRSAETAAPPDLPPPVATPVEVAVPAPVRTAPKADTAPTQPRRDPPRRARAAPASATSSRSDSTAGAASGQNAPEVEGEEPAATPTPSPQRTRTGSDLRDPWGD